MSLSIVFTMSITCSHRSANEATTDRIGRRSRILRDDIAIGEAFHPKRGILSVASYSNIDLAGTIRY